MFQVDYDPTRLTYAEVLAAVWGNRRGGRAWSRQYMEAVFCANAAQAAIAREHGIDAIVTGARFYLAEDYHQKYYLRHDTLLVGELAGYSPSELRESTVAARLNSYVAGHGSPTQLAAELPRLGLSARANEHLRKLVAQRARITCAS